MCEGTCNEACSDEEGQTNFGQHQVWPSQVWPIASLAERILAQNNILGQIDPDWWANFCLWLMWDCRADCPSAGTALPRTAQKFALFSLSRHNFHSFFPLLGVFSRNFGGVLKVRPFKCARLGSRAVV